MSHPRPKAIDLFSGCGGLSLGLKKANFSVVGAVEVDSIAAATYTLNHPRTHLWNLDVSELKASRIKSALGIGHGELDLLAGCPPCQGFSRMKTRNGTVAMRDRRNALVFEFLRLVDGLKPKTILLENVPGLVRHWRFKKLLKALAELGYQCSFEVRNAAEYGVPQRRRRLILMGSRLGPIGLPQPTSVRRTVKDAIAALPHPKKSDDILHSLPARRSEKVQALINMIPKNGGSRTDLPPAKQLKCHQDSDGFKDVYGRMSWDTVSPTITSGCINPSKGRFLHPSQNRAITLREAALLQSFPESYRFSLARGKYPVAEMIGNALPPEFVRYHGRVIGSHLRGHSTVKGR